jgi:hypothetical protein
MKIQSSSIAMSSQSDWEQSGQQSITETAVGNGITRFSGQAVRESSSVRGGGSLLQQDGATLLFRASSGEAATLDLSESAQKAVQSGWSAASSIDSGMALTPRQNLELDIIVRILQSLGGGKLKLRGLTDASVASFQDSLAAKFPSGFTQAIDFSARFPQMGVETTTVKSVHQEHQSMSFAAAGTVRTADGKSIGIDVSLNMSREFYAKNLSVSRSLVNMSDPLVLNFDGGAAELTDTKFRFDLDCDGIGENISFVGKNSGLLALDRNGDGKINDGSELFGTRSGDGFADLARYDDDGNGWIDENDEIYRNLRIWTRDSAGNDQLLALGVKGVGAIYLGNVPTSFALKNDSNTANGAIRSSGFYVREDGTSGTIQHVDFAV